MNATLEDFARVAGAEQGLVVVSTLRADHTIQASLVNAGVMVHPLSGEQVIAFVTYGAVKLANLRARAQVTVTARTGWNWVSAEGQAQIVGPDDPHPDVDADRLRMLLREVFTAAGGTHDDWDAYDATMREQRRAAVLMAPTRVYSNG